MCVLLNSCRYHPLEFVFDDNVLAVFPGQTLAVVAAPLEPALAFTPLLDAPLQACVSTFTSNDGVPVCKAVQRRFAGTGLEPVP
jgi:hypothetical protein